MSLADGNTAHGNCNHTPKHYLNSIDSVTSRCDVSEISKRSRFDNLSPNPKGSAAGGSALPGPPAPNYASHSYEDLATQPIHQIGRGYEAGNDANSLRHDAVFELRAAILPFGDDAVSCTLQTVPPIPISKW